MQKLILVLVLTFRTIYVHNMFSPCSAKIRASDKDSPVQVNLSQKPSFLHQLTHNMTTDFSLNSLKTTSSEHVYKNCFFVFVLTSKQYLYTTCSELVFQCNEKSLVILWVKWESGLMRMRISDTDLPVHGSCKKENWLVIKMHSYLGK